MTSLIDDAMVEKAAAVWSKGRREHVRPIIRAALTAVAEDIARKVREECEEECRALGRLDRE